MKRISIVMCTLLLGVQPVSLCARRAYPGHVKRPITAQTRVKKYKSPLQQLLHQKSGYLETQDNVRIAIKQFNEADCRHYLKTSRVLKEAVPLHINIVNNSPSVWVLSEKNINLHLANAKDVQRIMNKKVWGSFFKGVFMRMGFSFLAYPATYFMGSVFWGSSKDAITFGDCAKAGLLAAPWAVVKEGIPAIADNCRIKKDMKDVALATTWEVHPYTTANILVFADTKEFDAEFDVNLCNRRKPDSLLTFHVQLA